MNADSNPDTGSGSKYTVETGSGYLGVWKSNSSCVEISIGTYEEFPWRSTDDVYVVDDTPGIALVETSSGDVLAEADVFKQGVGTAVRVPRDALERLDGFQSGVDIRAYRRDAGGMRLVTKPGDPFVDGGTNDG